MEPPTPASSAPFVLPKSTGLIVLEDCFHFPGCFLPLYVYEQRYRQMLDHALSTSRLFCVGTQHEDELLPVSTAGLIRASKRRDDGTSHVMLYGVTRVRFTDWTQEKPFRIALIEPFHTLRQSNDDELENLKREAMSMLPPATPECGEAIRTLRSGLCQMNCADLACDVISYHFIRDPAVLRRLLLEPYLEERYGVLIHELKKLRDE
ncbi:MAG: LON peptidase substrate-binding domain-containing protein [Verrucomicrobiota bacterium]